MKKIQHFFIISLIIFRDGHGNSCFLSFKGNNLFTFIFHLSVVRGCMLVKTAEPNWTSDQGRKQKFVQKGVYLFWYSRGGAFKTRLGLNSPDNHSLHFSKGNACRLLLGLVRRGPKCWVFASFEKKWIT